MVDESLSPRENRARQWLKYFSSETSVDQLLCICTVWSWDCSNKAQALVIPARTDPRCDRGQQFWGCGWGNVPFHSLAQDTTFISVLYLATVPLGKPSLSLTPSSSGPLNLTQVGGLGGWLKPLSDLRYPFANPAQDVLFLPSAQLCLDPLGTEWDYPLGSKDLDGKEEPQKGGAGLPPTGCFPGPWRQDVSLDCKSSPEEAEARAWTVHYYGLLQSCLQQAGLPETQDRSQAPRTGASGL